MSDKAVTEDAFSSQYVPDWFVTHEPIELCDDVDDHLDDDELIEWCEGYEKRKAQKEQMKKELMPITWHPSRWWHWCDPEHEKKETETLCK